MIQLCDWCNDIIESENKLNNMLEKKIMMKIFVAIYYVMNVILF